MVILWIVVNYFLCLSEGYFLKWFGVPFESQCQEWGDLFQGGLKRVVFTSKKQKRWFFTFHRTCLFRVWFADWSMPVLLLSPDRRDRSNGTTSENRWLFLFTLNILIQKTTLKKSFQHMYFRLLQRWFRNKYFLEIFSKMKKKSFSIYLSKIKGNETFSTRWCLIRVGRRWSM